MEDLGINKFFPRRDLFGDCESCEWYFDHFEPKDLYTFYNSLRDKVCVNVKHDATPIKVTGLTDYDARMSN